MFRSSSRKLIPEEIIPKCENLFVGYSNDFNIRNIGSSGGVGTAVLRYLLDSEEVDAVIGVGFDEHDKERCIYKMIDHSSRVTELSGSKYVYMPLKPLLDLTQGHLDKRLAVVVEPCFVKAIKKLVPHCKYVLSFFCGYNITPEATEYLIRKAKVQKKDIYAIEYRGGKYPGGFTVHLNNGISKYFTKEHWELVDLLFLDKTCGRCRVFLSLEADIVLGDAWIRNLKKSTSILINTKEGDRIIQKMYHKNLLSLYDIDRSDVIKMHVHNLKFKTFGHSAVMKLVVRFFNNSIARKLAPLSLFGFASKIRRALFVGISDINLDPTKKYQMINRV